MLIVCPSCATSYDVQPARLEPDGRQVRCVRCRAVWRAELKQADRLVAAAAALAPDDEPLAAELPIGSGPMEAVAALEVPVGTESEAAQVDQPMDAKSADENSLHASAEGLDPQYPQPSETLDSGAQSSEPAEIEAPPIAPIDLDAGGLPIDVDVDPAAGLAAAPQNDIETFAARRSRKGANSRQRQWSLSRLQTAILALLVVDCILVGWRKDIVHVLPQTASLYAAIGLPVNLRGLSFANVTTSTETHEGVPILVVQGSIVNDTGGQVDVPRLRLEVRNAARQEVYSWTVAPPQAALPAYQSAGFHARLAAPPPEGRDVLVRFLNRRDVVADTR
jgi:predicted Zn finger-like uncharacterized protein